MKAHHGEYYTYPRETWDRPTCEKAARRVAKDGMGTKYPFRGYIGQCWGKHRYNGGFSGPDGDWYEGEIFLLPEVDPDFEIIKVPSWGYRIRLKGTE
ncbi:MAG: hypothetical protein ACYS7Y_04270 [Planctomycetota bacterium]|jgi:hypothetical protein